MVKQLCTRAWQSPTLTTWASFAARSLNLVLVLPLALGRYSAVEVQIWQILVTVSTLLFFLDLGMSPTFARLFARAVTPAGTEGAGSTDFARVEALWRTMLIVYRWLGALAVLLALLGGWIVMRRPLSGLEQSGPAWMALAAVAIASPLTFLALGYGAYLQGLNHVALVRRWEAISSLGASLSALLVVWLHGSFLILVLVNQLWIGVTMVRNRFLALRVESGRAQTYERARLEPAIWWEVWPAIWRSGLGVLLTSGFVQATGLIYAQFGEPAAVAAYFVALRYLGAVSQFSSAPFYSKLPILARLQALKKIDALVELSKRGMQVAHLTYVGGASILGIALPWAMKQTGAETGSTPSAIWWLLAMGFFFERFGAMHLQLFSTTNIIRWHVAGGVSGLIMMTVTIPLIPIAGAYAFPAGILAGYLGFYSWYSANLSYSRFAINPARFERTCAAPALLALVIVSVTDALIRPR
ncbi:MAG: hypothetical protein KF833_16800 [Verrucomicrobiae bacterium]|nr:hypothetical protein [Verrucomicrobiae bacterium]